MIGKKEEIKSILNGEYEHKADGQKQIERQTDEFRDRLEDGLGIVERGGEVGQLEGADDEAREVLNHLTHHPLEPHP